MNGVHVFCHRLKHLLEDQHLGGLVIDVDPAYVTLLVGEVLDSDLDVALSHLFD